MAKINKKNITIYHDINKILIYLSTKIRTILGDNLIGIYLFGSLSYGDFYPGSSDIDLVVIINRSLNHNENDLIKQLHNQVGEHFKKWRDRLECSYLPVNMLKNILPPKEH